MCIVSSGKPQRIMKFPWKERKLCERACKSASHRVTGKLQDSQTHKQHLRMLNPRLKTASESSVKAITRLCNSQTCFCPWETFEGICNSLWLRCSRFFRNTLILLMWRYLALKANYATYLHGDDLAFLFAFVFDVTMSIV